MRLYLDTEFNGFGGELISMALVAEEGGLFWYGAVASEEPVNEWVEKHVIPVINAPRMPRWQFREEFHRWIKGFDNPEVICDWHADAEYFTKMLAGRDYGTSLDFACRITILKTPPGQPVSKMPHNALADAVALKEWHLANEPDDWDLDINGR